MRAPSITHPEGPCPGLSIPRDVSAQRWAAAGEGGTRHACPTPGSCLQPLPCLAEPSRQRDVLKALGVLVRDFYAKYWICVCAGMFIVVSFAGRLVVYKIVYMFLFLLCLTLFQVGGAGDPSPSPSIPIPDPVPIPGMVPLMSPSPQVYYSLWRKVLKGFWWLVVAYTMLVLIAVYTFQFEDFPMYWRNLTGLTDEQ